MLFLVRALHRRRPLPPSFSSSSVTTTRAGSNDRPAPPLAPEQEPETVAAASATAGTQTGGGSRRWSSSGFAAGEDYSAAGTPVLPSAFPWREAPNDNMNFRGLVHRALHTVLQHQNRRFLRVACRHHDIDDEAFLRAAEMAFVQVAAGVFQIPAHHVIAPLEDAQGARVPIWDIPEGDMVDPRDVMHKDLADFYMQAMVATKMSRCTPFYRLHGFGDCKISNVNCLHKDWEPVVQKMKAIARHRLLKDSSMLTKQCLRSIRKTTIQVDVDLRCTETFFVSDERTDEVVQGSKAVGVSKHRLRLECSPLFKQDDLWEVVDLDNWMKGYSFR